MADSRILDGRASLVTGAGRGVGKGIALELARAGCRVAVNYDVGRESAEETVAEIRAHGVDAFALCADVRRSTAVSAMIARVAKRFGRLDVLVNNAAVQAWQAFLDIAEDDWDRTIDTNLKGTLLCTQAAARHMATHGGGSIVNIGSGSNKLPFPNLAAYSASKAAIEMLTRAAAIELGPLGIRVNCVAPGAIEVERTRLETPDYAERWGAITPLGRVGTPADVGGAVVFLASDAASFCTGQTLWVDGGLFTQPRWAYDDATGSRAAAMSGAARATAAAPRDRRRKGRRA